MIAFTRNRRTSAAAPAVLLLLGLTLASLSPVSAAVTQSASSTPTILNDFGGLISSYQNQIQAKRDAIDQMKQQMGAYQQQIESERRTAATIGDQLAIVTNKIAQTDLDIKSNQLEIDASTMELNQLDAQIQVKTLKIIAQQGMIAELLRTIRQNDGRTTMDVLLTEKTISDFFNDVQFLQQSQRELSDAIDVAKTLKADLEKRQAAASAKRQHLQEVLTSLGQDKDALSEDQNAKVALQTQAQATQTRYQYELAQLKREADAENADVAEIERKLRKTLDAQKLQRLSGNPGDWGWPVDPSRGISTYFHDPDYPFRYIFEHPGIDIRASQGTPIHATKGGYVARAHDAGMGYSYIMLVHDDGMSTVYGHVSRILVKEDTYVEKGDVIGYSGATPGTPGAGPLTTGPHLHFEVRLNGIPVDPLQYLKL